MAGSHTIRESTGAEHDSVLSLYSSIFPNEDLRPLVADLLGGRSDVLSLVACDDNALIGHVMFTRFDGPESDSQGVLLGPLGILPNHRKQGIGTALVEDGIERLHGKGIAQIFVLGDPAYYGRIGFRPERQVTTPYPLPPEWRDAWQSRVMPGGRPLAAGPCILPEPWMKPALWSA